MEAGPLGAALEDWYLVEDWAALGALNTAAVTGPRRVAHDGTAQHAGPGIGGIYGLVSGEPTSAASFRMRIAKPTHVPYPSFEGALRVAIGPAGAIWKRQLVLGTDLEFLVNAPAAPVTDSVHGGLIDVSALQLVP